MPYVSKKQEAWAHTAAAKKAGFPTAEFDKASKGLKLPVRSGTVKQQVQRAHKKVKKGLAK